MNSHKPNYSCTVVASDMNNHAVMTLAILFLAMISVSSPLSIYAKEYHSTSQITASLLNECSSEDGTTNCANNNAETYGDDNNVNPQVSQSSRTNSEGPGQVGRPIIRLSNHIFTNIPGSSSLPDIAAAGNNVYAVWVDESRGNTEIYYRESSNGGATFGPTQNVSNNPRQSTSPSIAGSNQ